MEHQDLEKSSRQALGCSNRCVIVFQASFLLLTGLLTPFPLSLDIHCPLDTLFVLSSPLSKQKLPQTKLNRTGGLSSRLLQQQGEMRTQSEPNSVKTEAGGIFFRSLEWGEGRTEHLYLPVGLPQRKSRLSVSYPQEVALRLGLSCPPKSGC